MHKVLWFIVQADSEGEAVEKATESFENEVMGRTDTTYDYCKPMESGHSVAGSDRWTGFKDEPIAAPLASDQGVEWVEEALGYQERRTAENLYGFLQAVLEEFEASVETAPNALDEILAFVHETRDELSWSSGGERIREEWPRTVEALHRGENSMARYYAGCLREGNFMEASVIDCYTYNHPTVPDASYRLESVEELLDDRPKDAWVVPLDCHH